MPFAGKPLLLHVLERLRSRADEFIVSIGKHHEPDHYRSILPDSVTVVQDAVDFEGPLAGLVTSLGQCKSPFCFVVACDLPLVQPRVVDYLFERAEGMSAAVPKWLDGRLEPTHAVYARDSTSQAARGLSGHHRGGIIDLVASLSPVAYVGVEREISQLDPDLGTFRNLNTPQDLANAERTFQQA